MGNQQDRNEAFCPVCGVDLAEMQQRCRRCDWQLTSPKELWTPNRALEDAILLDEQRHKLMLGAAAAAHARGSENSAWFYQLTQGIRQLGGLDRQLNQVYKEYKVQFSQFLNAAQASETSLLKALSAAQSARQSLVLVEVNWNEVRLGLLDPNQPGTAAWLHRDARQWSEYAGQLPAASPERDLALATGFGVDLEAVQNWLDDFLVGKLPKEWKISKSQPVYVCTNLSGWAAVESLVLAIKALEYPVERIPYSLAQPENFDTLISRLLKKLPQPYTLALLTAVVNQANGAVSLVAHDIFKKGAQAGLANSYALDIRFVGAPGQRCDLVMVKYTDDPTQYEYVQSWGVEIPTSSKLKLHALLPEPGNPDLSADGATLLANEVDLTRIKSETPRTLTLGVDLALILDTLADEPAWKERLKFARELIETIQTRLGKGQPLRVAVLAYGDREHWDSTDERPPHLRSHAFNTVPEALNFLGKLNRTRIEINDFEAALEDALLALQGLQWGGNHQRLAVTLGQRPPHPRVIRYPRQIPNLNLDWEGLIQTVKHVHKVKSWVVRCPLVWSASAQLQEEARKYADLFWKTWGYSGLFDLERRVTPADLVQAILKVPSADPALRIPLLANSSED